MKRKFTSILCFLMLLSFSGFAQKQISGKVVDEENLPIPGVTVLEKGTNNGTTTNAQGEYKIDLEKAGNTLVFSFVGFKNKEVVTAGQSEINIKMVFKVSELDEVVVVGYGVQKKSVVTGAISKVKAKDLENQQNARVEQSLQGRTSGVRVTTASGQPGASATVRIRGTGTINNSDPLYVVDGVPILGGIDYLNQGDIESMEVLKDAASAAIYGARAANGVILITTKAGKKGGMQVNYNTYFGIQNPWRKIPLLNAKEYATIINEASAAANQTPPFENPNELGEGTDWQDEVFYFNAPMQNHDLSIGGGNDRSTYHSSFSYYDQEGIVARDKSNYKRLTVRFNSTHKVSPKLTFGNNIGYTHVRASGVAENSEFGSPLGIATNIDPITPVYETDPDKLANYDPDAVKDDEGRTFAITNLVTSEVVNPLARLYVTHNRGFSDKIVGNVFGEYELIKGLKLRSSIGTDLAFYGNDGFTPVHYLNATNVVRINNVSKSFNRGFVWIFENTLSYNKTFDKHNLSAVAGITAQKNKGEALGGGKQDLPTNDPDQAFISAATNLDSESIYGFAWHHAILSYFGRVNYNFNEKYLFSAVLRMDGSSRFGVNNRFGIFPSVSAGWLISEEDFFKFKKINYLKLRGSWGQNGNENIGDFLFVSTVSGGSNYTFGSEDVLTNGVKPTTVANPDLRWETSEQTNIGIDTRFLKNFTLTFDWFSKKTKDMLIQIPVPDFVGNGAPIGNAGDMENTGFEIELGYDNGTRKQFQYRFAGNISYVENKVTFLGNEEGFLTGATFGPQGLQITRISEGLPIGYFFGYETDGIFQNQAEVNAHSNADGELLQPDAVPGDIRFKDTNGDGTIDDFDRGMIGDPTPNWTYGFTFNAAYRNFDFMLFGQGVFGNDIYKATRRYDLPRANYTADVLDRWTGEGTSDIYPRVTLNDANRNFSRSSDFYIENGAFFRIKNIQLGYNLNENITNKIRIKKARIYVGFNNLLTLTQYSGFDPEIGASFGIDRGIYPQARTFITGLNITF